MEDKKKPYHPPHHHHPCDDLRLEAVTVSVGFDDLLDVSLGHNNPHVDTYIVVTAHDDHKTAKVCAKHGAMCVKTDLFSKNQRTFNKGAAINAGFAYFQYNGWRAHVDADVLLPDNFRRVVFNHAHLDKQAIYGADRVNVVGFEGVRIVRDGPPQHQHRCLVEAPTGAPIGARFVSQLHGYLPLGYFQFWNAKTQKPYPYSLGTAAHDDTMFAALWPEHKRHLLPHVVVYHLCAAPPKWGENWEGRKSARLEKKR